MSDLLTAQGLTAAQQAAFHTYLTELLDWNTRVNLTAITTPDEVIVKHFLDSLTLLPFLPPGPIRLIDVGAGAGFPGLPLKLVRPEIHLTLLESVGKKCAFLTHLAKTFALKDIDIVQSRAEDLGHSPIHRGSYHVATARAVARLPALLEYLLPFLKPGGLALAQKGDTAPTELADSANALRELGGSQHDLAAVTLPGLTDTRYIVAIRKTGPTPRTYPRRAGIPTRQPL